LRSSFSRCQVVLECLILEGHRDGGVSNKRGEVGSQGAQEDVAAALKLRHTALSHAQAVRHFGLGDPSVTALALVVCIIFALAQN